MISLKPQVLSALKANAPLVALLGGHHIYFQVAPDAKQFPRITFFEMTNRGSVFADDTEIGSDISFQMDVWSKGNTTTIALEVDKTMKSLGFSRDSATDLYEDDIGIYHKAMRFSTTVELEE
ncbi:MAG: tail completion protein gp17 [Desulfitobacteriaceae bacterium]